MSSPVLPNFLLVGAAKCGTTSLAAYLQQHPGIFIPEIKEPDYFCLPEYDQSVMNTQSVGSWDEYLALFESGKEFPVRGEGSTHYLFLPGCAEKIRSALGKEVKLLMVLRNPVDAMYSLWSMFVRYGWEHRSARKALLSASLDATLSPQTYIDLKSRFLYAKRVMYYEQVQRYFDVFDRENIKILFFEELFSDLDVGFADICSFLEVSSDFRPELRVHNKGVMVRSSRLVRFFADFYPKYLYPVTRRVLPDRFRAYAKEKVLGMNVGEKKPIDEELRGTLKQRLSPSVRELEATVGRDLSNCWF